MAYVLSGGRHGRLLAPDAGWVGLLYEACDDGTLVLQCHAPAPRAGRRAGGRDSRGRGNTQSRACEAEPQETLSWEIDGGDLVISGPELCDELKFLLPQRWTAA